MAGSVRESGCIQSFVFLDLETSGLFPVDAMNPLDDPPIPGSQRDLSQILRNHIKLTSSRRAPHVTEIGLMSATRKTILSAIRKIDSWTQNDEEYGRIPLHSKFSSFRIPCNIYTAQTKPKMCQGEWVEYEKGRLQYHVFAYSREELEEKNDFATEWNGVKLFLEQTPKPACLIAHNGLRFDFRALHAEFDRNGLLGTNPIPNEIYFIDSYLMFLDLEKKLHDELRTAVRLLDWAHLSAQIKSKSPQSPPKRESSSQSVETTSQTVSNVVYGTSAARQTQVTLLATSRNDDNPFVSEELQSTTFIVPPESPFGSEPKRPPRRRLFAETSDDHPLNFIRTTQWSPAKKKRVRPNLFKRSSEGDWVFNSHFSIAYFRERGTFNLESMYKQLLNGNYDAHFALDDCEALLKICIAYGEEFVQYIDTHAAEFPF